jgi:toxin YoeB
MAKKEVVWSAKAQQDRIAILEYWIDHNKSKTYSENLLKLFIEASELISEHPRIGKPTDFTNVRFKIVKNYLLFYEETEQRVNILFVWDSRQNPEILVKQLEKKKT